MIEKTRAAVGAVGSLPPRRVAALPALSAPLAEGGSQELRWDYFAVDRKLTLQTMMSSGPGPCNSHVMRQRPIQKRYSSFSSGARGSATDLSRPLLERCNEMDPNGLSSLVVLRYVLQASQGKLSERDHSGARPQ